MFSLTEVHPNIFELKFKKHLDLVFHFIRFQEYYENADNYFRDRNFELIYFIQHYSELKEGSFTYAKDWAGFNIPSHILYNIFKGEIKDFNSYDLLMKGIYEYLTKKCRDDTFYLIGTSEEINRAIEHEIAHGLYYTNPDYQMEMRDLIIRYNNELKLEKLYKVLREKYYYADGVMYDEIQAYLSTGIIPDIKKVLDKESDAICKQFSNVFKKYYNKETLNGKEKQGRSNGRSK